MVKIIIVISIILISSFGVFKLFEYLGSIKQNFSPNVVLKFVPLPSVNQQSFPVIQDEVLTLIPLNKENKNPIVTNIPLKGISFRYSRNQGISTTAPDPSPDFKKIAFIENNSLQIITADGKNKLSLSPSFEVSEIWSWSPDSKKILVSSPTKTLEEEMIISGMGESGVKQTTTFPKERIKGGNYLVDIENGEVTSLYPTDGASSIQWIGSNKLLVEMGHTNREGSFFIFDVTNFRGDAKTFENLGNDYFGRHFSSDSLGKKWAVSLGNTGNNPAKESSSNIVIADFPSLKGTIINQGSWASVQSPYISPPGTKVIYVVLADLDPQWNIGIWDGTNKSILEDARPVMWINDNEFIYETGSYGQNTQLYIYDIPSSNKIRLY